MVLIAQESFTVSIRATTPGRIAALTSCAKVAGVASSRRWGGCYSLPIAAKSLPMSRMLPLCATMIFCSRFGNFRV